MTPPPKDLLREGIALFNRGQFFQCHEVLEEAWLEASGEQKIFLQGLIQLAVALHHLRRGNLAGAGRLLTASMEKLSGFTPPQDAVDVMGLLATLEPLREAISAGAIRPDWKAPQIRAKTPPVPSFE